MTEASCNHGDTIKLLSGIKAMKVKTCNVKPVDDYPPGCHTTCMVVTKDGQWLLVDSSGSVVKLFSKDMEFITSIDMLQYGAYQIAVVSGQEAVVTNTKKELIILDISEAPQGKLSIKCVKQLKFHARAIVNYKEKLIVTAYLALVEPASVKLIDQTGHVYWSMSNPYLISKPNYLCCYGDTVVVSDEVLHMLTLLNADTGKVVTSCHASQNPRGLTADISGNIYTVFYWASEVAVFTRNLTDERVLLTDRSGIGLSPYGIAYDSLKHQLMVSYLSGTDVDCFQLS